MDKLIFVCYQHGFGGENLSHRISQHPLCDRLLVKTEKGRTVIKNDIFNKVFLGFNNNFQYNFQDKEKLCIKIIKDFKNKIDKVNKFTVVPSHVDAKILRKFFTNSYFVTIKPPNTKEQQQQYLQHLYNNYWLYKTTDITEYIGEIYCKIEMFNDDKTKKEIKKITKEILSKYRNKLSFGQIQCVLNGLEPSTKNMKKLFSSLHNKENFRRNDIQIDNKNYVVNFDSAKTIDINKFFTHFKMI
jgi:hypothetical protein